MENQQGHVVLLKAVKTLCKLIKNYLFMGLKKPQSDSVRIRLPNFTVDVGIESFLELFSFVEKR